MQETACNEGDVSLIPGPGRSPAGANGNPLQYSFLENPMDRGTWRAIVHGVAETQTWLSDWTTTNIWNPKTVTDQMPHLSAQDTGQPRGSHWASPQSRSRGFPGAPPPTGDTAQLTDQAGVGAALELHRGLSLLWLLPGLCCWAPSKITALRISGFTYILPQTDVCLVAQSCLTLWDSTDCTAHQAPLFMGFPRQEYWSRLPFLLQGVFLAQGSSPGLLCLLHCR